MPDSPLSSEEYTHGCYAFAKEQSFEHDLGLDLAILSLGTGKTIEDFACWAAENAVEDDLSPHSEYAQRRLLSLTRLTPRERGNELLLCLLHPVLLDERSVFVEQLASLCGETKNDIKETVRRALFRSHFLTDGKEREFLLNAFSRLNKAL